VEAVAKEGDLKAVILCGGEATRLRPLTHAMPKHLIPITNRPVIEHIIFAIKQAGLEEIGLVVSPKTIDHFHAHLQDGTRLGIKLEYILQEEPKGLAHAVACVRDFVGEGNFLVYLGDNLLEKGIVDQVKSFAKLHPDALISLIELDDPRRFGVVRLEKGEIKELIEKPQRPLSNLAIAGVYVFTPVIFRAISEIVPSFRGELEITDAIQKLIDWGYCVLPHRIEGWWKDVGRPEDLLEANRLVLEGLKESRIDGAKIDVASSLEGPVSLAPGVVIQKSQIVGPVIVGERARIVRSEVGPYVAVGARCQLIESSVQNTIIEGAQVEGNVHMLSDSIIGAATVVALRGNKVLQLIMSDYSQVAMRD